MACTAFVTQVDREAAARTADAVLVEQSAVEPHRRIERADLVHQHVRQFGLERVGILGAREVAALMFTRGADGAREPAHDLPHAGLVAGLARHASLAEVLAHHDVGGELRPLRRYLDALHREHGRAVGIRDDGAALFPLHIVERIFSLLREAACDVDAGLGGGAAGGLGGDLFGQSLRHGTSLVLEARGMPLLLLCALPCRPPGMNDATGRGQFGWTRLNGRIFDCLRAVIFLRRERGVGLRLRRGWVIPPSHMRPQEKNYPRCAREFFAGHAAHARSAVVGGFARMSRAGQVVSLSPRRVARHRAPRPMPRNEFQLRRCSHGPQIANVCPGDCTFTNSVCPSGEKHAPANSRLSGCALRAMR